MWSALGSIASYTGSLASATYTGIMGTGETLPYDCSYPFKKVSPDMHEMQELSKRHFEQGTEVMNSSGWSLMEIRDPDGGDMKAQTRPQIGTHHFVKVTFSVPNTPPWAVARLLNSESFDERKKYSADLASLEVLGKKDNTMMVHVSYSVPPPVAWRDMVMIANMAEDKEENVHVWGCSVDSERYPEGWNSCVRGSVLWMWKLTPVGPHTLCNYITVFDPRGWTPPFLVSWLKSSATSEFVALRAVLTGKATHLHKVTFEEMGVKVDAEEAKKAQKEQEEKDRIAKTGGAPAPAAA